MKAIFSVITTDEFDTFLNVEKSFYKLKDAIKYQEANQEDFGNVNIRIIKNYIE